MSDELRSQAQRFVDAIEMTDGLIGIQAGEADDPFHLSAKFARIWLAEHPADDDEPVTEGWLRSVGFWERGHSDICICSPGKLGTYEEASRASPWMLIYTDNFREPGKRMWCLSFPACQASLGYDLPTRGDVRRLAKALGIELKETP